MRECVSWNVIDKLGKQPRTHAQVMPSHVVSHKVSHEVLCYVRESGSLLV